MLVPILLFARGVGVGASDGARSVFQKIKNALAPGDPEDVPDDELPPEDAPPPPPPPPGGGAGLPDRRPTNAGKAGGGFVVQPPPRPAPPPLGPVGEQGCPAACTGPEIGCFGCSSVGEPPPDALLEASGFAAREGYQAQGSGKVGRAMAFQQAARLYALAAQKHQEGDCGYRTTLDEAHRVHREARAK